MASSEDYEIFDSEKAEWFANIQRRSRMAEKILAGEEEFETPSRPRSLTEVATSRLEEKILEEAAPSTGYYRLDNLVKGFIPGHLYVVTGNTNVGKTALACNFTERVRRQGKRILYFALEPENTIVDYLASVRLNKEFSELTPSDISFDDDLIHVYGKDAISTIEDLINAIEISDISYDLIVIDHIGYFIKSQNNFIQEQSNAVKKLVGLAKRKRCAIMTIAHLRKQPPGRSKATPTADDISGSSAFKQDATEVFIVVRYIDEQDENKLRYTQYGSLFVAKTKAGANGSMDLIFSHNKANIVAVDEIPNA